MPRKTGRNSAKFGTIEVHRRVIISPSLRTPSSCHAVLEMPQELPESDIFVLLAKRRRRLTLEILQESPSALTTMELAERLVDREFEDASADELRTVYLALRHNHLPRLAESDVVEYDVDRETVHPGVNFDTLVGVLERARMRELPWSDE